MKISAMILALTLSANVIASEINDLSAFTTGSTLLYSATISGEFNKAQAVHVINDSQEYFQSGKLSAFLAQKVSEVQAEKDVSIDEAVDFLVQYSETF